MPEKIVYETHIIKNPLLPFVFLPDRVRYGNSRRANWHENVEFLYCTQGEGYVGCGMVRYPLRAGELYVVNSDTIHSNGSDSSMTLHCLIVDKTFFAENGFPIQGLYFQKIIRDLQISVLFDGIYQAYGRFCGDNLCAVADIRFAVLDLLRYLCRNYTVTNTASVTPADPYIKKTITYIRVNLHRPITLDELAAYTGLSKYHLSRQFKATTGSTIIEYVNQTRCAEAKRLMENGVSVSSAALSCGYENLSYFSRTYKRLMGELPSAACSHTGRSG